MMSNNLDKHLGKANPKKASKFANEEAEWIRPKCVNKLWQNMTAILFSVNDKQKWPPTITIATTCQHHRTHPL
jgi:hypothetical protein